MKNTPTASTQNRFLNRFPSVLKAVAEMENEMERWMGQGAYERSSDYDGYNFNPACDIKENNREYTLQFDVPGVKKEDVTIEIDSGCLTVRGERRGEKEEKKDKHFLSETCYGSFMRSFALPTPVDESNIDAHYEDGVLTIRASKVKASRPKAIEIH